MAVCVIAAKLIEYLHAAAYPDERKVDGKNAGYAGGGCRIIWNNISTPLISKAVSILTWQLLPRKAAFRLNCKWRYHQTCHAAHLAPFVCNASVAKRL